MTAFAFRVVKINGTLLPGVRLPDFQRREKQMPSEADGSIYQTSSPVLRAAPMARWATIAVKTLWGLFGTATRPPYILLDGTNGLELIGPKINATTPGYDATAVHASRKGLSGLIMLAGLSWRPGDVVEATVEAFWTTSAGGTDPITSAAVALPTIPVNTEQLVLSSVSGIPSTRIASLDVAITHQVENNDETICYNAGLPFPVLLKQPGVGGSVEVIATFETTDLTTTISNGTVVITMGVLNHNGVGLAAGTAVMTINSPQIREEQISGSPASRRVTVRGTWDGTNFPVALTST